MVDFSAKLKKKEIQKKRDPIEIYQNLDRKSEIGPLRPAQEHILKRWYLNRKDDKDLIIKLHTGEGKTLIGLLLLLSKANAGEGPCLYVCPNIYLVDQVCSEAAKFGIPVCKIPKDNSFPNDFCLGKSILVTHVQKLFNGKTIFGIGTKYEYVGTVVLDDSHACIEAIKKSVSLSISKEDTEAYDRIKHIFEDDLREQGEGSYFDLDNNASEIVLPIPYWCWIEKSSKVAEILSQHSNDECIKYSWPILRDRLNYCQAFISQKKLEIVPIQIPIDDFGTFSKAKQRILMSATTQDDSFFIKGLNFGVDSIEKPLTNPDQKWSGEKMIIIPSLISEELDRELVLSKFAKTEYKHFGVVSIVSSFKKANYYRDLGASVVDGKTNEIYETITKLKHGKYGPMVVLVNRYDGIDLPDESCRILFIDSLPFFDSLNEKYEEQCRANSDLINIKLAQKIEQGLGRSVRGEKDYSVVVLLGSDLVKFAKSISTKKYFSSQTQKQIDIGIEIAKMAEDDIEEEGSKIKLILSLIKQSLNRDEGWKNYYFQEMESNNVDKPQVSILRILEKEKEAIDYLISLDREKAYNTFQYIVDQSEEEHEKGWYIQMMAYVRYFDSKIDSNNLQLTAFKKNSQLLKPKDGVKYTRISYINQSRINRIKNKLANFKSYEEITYFYNSIYDDLTFDNDSEKFEKALQEIGFLLGFESQRPDKEIRKGPDNLWCVEKNKYIMFECKNEVKENRKSISKTEAGQMDQHCAWFKDEYKEVEVKRIMVISTKNLSYEAYFTKDVEIMRKAKLKLLKDNVKNFIKEFNQFAISELTDDYINNAINTHKLDIDSLFSIYSEKPYKMRAE